MTRAKKRFVKTLMGNGVPRNRAIILAERRPSHESYDDFLGWAVLISAMMDFGKSARRIRKKVMRFSRSAHGFGCQAHCAGKVVAYSFLDEIHFASEESPPC